MRAGHEPPGRRTLALLNDRPDSGLSLWNLRQGPTYLPHCTQRSLDFPNDELCAFFSPILPRILGLQTLPEVSHPAALAQAPGVYRCEACGCVVPPRTPAYRRVLKKRQKEYPYRPKANRVVRLSDNGKPKESFVDDPGGTGEEIAGEMMVCPACANQ